MVAQFFFNPIVNLTGETSQWITAITTIAIAVITFFYLKATRKIMRITEDSLKFSRETFLSKEKPFLFIVSAKLNNQFSNGRLDLEIRNGGSAMAIIGKFEVKIIKANDQTSPILGQPSYPKLFVPPGETRVEAIFFSVEKEELQTRNAEFLATEIGLYYKGIYGEDYIYIFTGTFHESLSEFLRIAENDEEFKRNKKK